jgi:hypothetical protein
LPDSCLYFLADPLIPPSPPARKSQVALKETDL